MLTGSADELGTQRHASSARAATPGASGAPAPAPDFISVTSL